jgi:hypothetical protein
MHAGRSCLRLAPAFAAGLVALFGLLLSASGQHINSAGHALPSATPAPRLSVFVAGSLAYSFSPRELLAHSDLVVVATVVGQRVVPAYGSVTSDSPGVPAETYTTVAVARVVYDPRHRMLVTGALLVVRTQGGTIGDTTVWVEDEPTFSVGERVVLFLTAVYGGKYICTNLEQGAVPVDSGMVTTLGNTKITEVAFIDELQGG